ncbi:hypothetical protein [Paludibacter jiangxiensis]|uniref:MG2 domain-containing protein n=1 Tax=Paludibacter jiangxiensis TaxID=681398 RepID=A0A161LCV2_9BACT|nr:hypothetical protein [Paludibacter jiangxiensis]GAT61557.1 hypothetical protein PJIAN_1137 [Paludibacter jiangxiensis]
MKYLLSIIFVHCILYSAFAQNFPIEKLALQTDRETYVTGEPVLFKLDVLDAATHRPSSISKIGYIVLRNANSTTIRQLRIRIDDGAANGNISLPDTLSSGLYQIVAFTNLLRNYGEKFYFKKQLTIINQSDTNFDFYKNKSKPTSEQSANTDSPLSIECDSTHYKPCQRIAVKLHSVSSGANVAVSVFESNSQYTCKPAEPANNFDHKLITTYAYLPETKGNILKGEVLDATSQQKIKNAVVLLSRIDTVPNLKYAITDSEGKFRMFLSNYYDGKDLFLTIKDVPKNANWKIKIEDKFALNQKFTPSPLAGIDTAFFTKSQNVVYINKSYEIDPHKQEKANEVKPAPAPRFYFGSATTIYPADFTPLDNFSEIVTELVPLLYIRKQGDKKWLDILGAASNQFENKGAALFLDGVYVDDINKILDFGSDIIKKIDVLYKERCFGDLVFQGMVAISGKENLIRTLTPASYSLRIMNPAIANNYFLSANADPATANKNKPFVTQLLYWNPNIFIFDKKDTEIVFFTSENKGTYTIKAEGFTQNGEPVCTSTKIEVK